MIFNATLHKPTPEQAAAGVGPPRGREVPLGADFGEIRELAREVIREARAAEAETVLLGGLSSMAIALYDEAVGAGLPVVEAVTERILDERGRFVFRHRGFRTLWRPDGEPT